MYGGSPLTRPSRLLLFIASAVFFILALLTIIQPITASPSVIQGAQSLAALPYSQNFDSLANTGTPTWTNDSTILGWYSNRTSYIASNGSSTSGGLYSFGSTSATDRALGSIASSSATLICWGARFVNDTGATVSSLVVGYTGEQWRDANTTIQNLDFSYRVAPSVTDVTSGTYTDVNALDFNSIKNTGAGTALDGNLAANRQALSATISLSIPAGEEIMLRWCDPDNTGSDHGLGVDDLVVSAGAAPTPTPSPTPTATPVPPPAGALLINELDYDNPGTDGAEFIEIYNTTGSAIGLNSCSLQLFNDLDASPYRTIALSGSLASMDYYVVCGNSSNVSQCDLDVSPDSDLIQNGPNDGLRLVCSAAVIDGLSYEGNTNIANEGGVSAPTDPGVVATNALSRCPNGVDTNNNGADFELITYSPGVGNNCLPDLVMTKSGPANAAQGETITYTLSVSNIGKAAATNTTVSDTLPGGVNFVEANPPANTGPNPLVWNLGTLAYGATQSFVVTVTVDTTTTGSINNTVTASTDVVGENTGNNTANATTHIFTPDLAVTKIGPAFASQADTISYTISLANSGDGVAPTVTLTDSLPGGVTFVGANPAPDGGPNPLVWSFGDLPPSSLQSVLVTVTIDITTSGPITNTVSAATTGGENTGNNDDSVTTQVSLACNLIISEIMYDPNGAEPDWEWVEIYNPSETDLNLANFILDDDDGSALAASNIASGVVPAGSSVILFNAALSEAAFTVEWGSGDYIPVTNWPDLPNSDGDHIGIWTDHARYNGRDFATACASVSFPDSSPAGASIHLTDLENQNSWVASTACGPTPVYAGYNSQDAGGAFGDIGSPTTGAPGCTAGPDTLFIRTLLPDSCDNGDDAEYVLACNFGGATVDLTGYSVGDHGIRTRGGVKGDTVFQRDYLLDDTACSDGDCTIAPNECALLTSFTTELTRKMYEPAFGIGTVPAPTSDPSYYPPFGLSGGFTFGGDIFQFGRNFGSSAISQTDFFDAKINNTGDVIALFNEIGQPLACVSFGNGDNRDPDVDPANNDCATIFDGGSAVGDLPLLKYQAVDDPTSLQGAGNGIDEDYFYYLYSQIIGGVAVDAAVEGLCQLQVDSQKSVTTQGGGTTALAGETITYTFVLSNVSDIPANAANTLSNLPTVSDDFDDRILGISCEWLENGPGDTIDVGDGGILNAATEMLGRRETAVLQCVGTLDPFMACSSVNVANSADFTYASLDWTWVNDGAPSFSAAPQADVIGSAGVTCGGVAHIGVDNFEDVTNTPPYFAGESFTLAADISNLGNVPLVTPVLTLTVPNIVLSSPLSTPVATCSGPSPALPAVLAVGQSVNVSYDCVSNVTLPTLNADFQLEASAANIVDGVGSCSNGMDTLPVPLAIRLGRAVQASNHAVAPLTAGVGALLLLTLLTTRRARRRHSR